MSAQAGREAPEREGSRLWPLLMTFGVLCLLGLFLLRNRERIARTYEFEPLHFVAVAALVALSLALRSVANQRLFGALGAAASWSRWFRLICVTSFSNLIPSAGLVGKALFLKRVHDMPFATFGLGQLTFLLLILATNGAAGWLALVIFRPASRIGLVSAALLLMAVVPVVVLHLRRVPGFLRARLPADLSAVRASRPAWPAVVLLQLAMLGVGAAALSLCFDMGEQRVGYVACLVFVAAGALTRLVAITPGALGVRELLTAGIAQLLGADFANALVAVTLFRAVELAVVVALGGVFTYSISGDWVRGDSRSAR